jgi:hypothetical protein
MNLNLAAPTRAARQFQKIYRIPKTRQRGGWLNQFDQRRRPQRRIRKIKFENAKRLSETKAAYFLNRQ